MQRDDATIHTYKIYEQDIYDSLVLLVRSLEADGILPLDVMYRGVDNDHAVWVVVGYASE
jgi:hypothetical protein